MNLKNTKKIKYIIFGVMCFFAVIIIMASIFAAQVIKKIEIKNVELSTIKDGNYIGEFSNSPVQAKVEVIVKDNKITTINLLEHNYMLGKKGETIIDEVLTKQTLNVDMKTGATVSSMTIVKAIENALEGK